ncbi:hypothetical protein DPMN_194578 [Dreissena polymorpha]|uniref:Uncharacterized protein n=1 Tax=Dreissena polymorpha TaxID=45954 RepID=A0A9D3Y2R1_DREPO|nr:hypothetical protein DPMN_194578 [Dreissena polymorpha]
MERDRARVVNRWTSNLARCDLRRSDRLPNSLNWSHRLNWKPICNKGRNMNRIHVWVK